MNQPEETVLFERVKNGGIEAFEILFHRYYRHLCVFSSHILHDDDSAEEIVQDFFVRLWEKRNQILIETSVKNYFFRSVKNLCLNHIQHDKTKIRYSQHIRTEGEKQTSDEDLFFEMDLSEKIEESINSLPEKRQEIFRLSREEGLKYREIADRLNISVKTVEAQMGLAIKTLREKLKKYNTFFTLLLCVFSKQNRG
jgi:RNA polymerase sigma-70 factor (ECF subfamily)